MIIAFCGPDGSGKTTQARLLYRLLSLAGFRVRYIRFKAHHLASFVLLKILQSLKIIPKSSCSPVEIDYNIKVKLAKAMHILLFLEVVSAIIWLNLNVNLFKKLNYLIVAERYVPDFLVTLDFILGGDISKILQVTKILNSFQKQAIIICLFAEPKTLIKRRRNERLTMNYAKYLLFKYRLLAKAFSWPTVDTTNKTILEVHREVFKLIFSFIAKII